MYLLEISKQFFPSQIELHLDHAFNRVKISLKGVSSVLKRY